MDWRRDRVDGGIDGRVDGGIGEGAMVGSVRGRWWDP